MIDPVPNEERESNAIWESVLLTEAEGVRVLQPLELLIREEVPGGWVAMACEGLFETAGYERDEVLSGLKWFLVAEYLDYASSPPDQLGKLAKKKLAALEQHFGELKL